MVDTPAAAQLYVPRFNMMDADDVRPFVHAVAAAQLVTVGDDGVPDATFLPVLWEGERLVGHLARANGHWRRIVDGSPALAVVTGPDTYVSPSWYASKAEHGKVVPTWNYSVVHLRGRIRVHDDPEWVRGLVTRLTDRHEGERRTQRRTASHHQAEGQRGRRDLPAVGRVRDRHGLEHLLVEGVGRRDEVTHPLVGREQHAVTRGVLDHDVREPTPRRVVPATHDHADAAHAADAGDPAGEALPHPTRLHGATSPAGSRPSAARPAATPARSSSDRFWLSLAFASTDETTTSTPTIGRRFLSM